MPAIAILVCTAIVLYLLSIERHTSQGVTAAVWVPTLWMLIIASRPLALWFSTGQSGATGGDEASSALDRWVLIALAALAMVVVWRRRYDCRAFVRRHKWLFLLLTFMFISTFWSDMTDVALRRWVREAILVVMTLSLMSEPEPWQAFASILRRCAYVLIPFSLVLIKYFPALGRSYGRWSGVTTWTGVGTQKNQLGRLCMISVFFLFCALYRGWHERPAGYARRQRWADVVIALLGLYLLIGSNSSTSLATLVMGISLFLVLQLLQRLRLDTPRFGLHIAAIALLAFGTATPFLGGTNVADFTGAVNRDSTLTGRTDIWREILPKRAQRPLLGYGVGSFWTEARRTLYRVPTAHNGYLDILLELGEAGLLLYAVWFLACARQLQEALARNYREASFAICLLLMGLLYNLSESTLNNLAEHMTAVLILASAIAARPQVPTAISCSSINSCRSCLGELRQLSSDGKIW